MKIRRLLFASAVLLVFVSISSAQTTTAAITGTVTDPSGALIPNVKVTARNNATNIANTARTNEAGVYNFPFLASGDYTVSAEIEGFKKVVLGPFRLEVNQTARVDPKLEVGALSESVEVGEIAPVLQTEGTQTGEVISATELTDVPLKGGNFAIRSVLAVGNISTNGGNM